MSAVGRAGESYFLMVFAAQGEPNVPRLSHTWATVIKATGEGPAAESYRLEAHTISWMPRSMAVATWRPLPEIGVNLDLAATLRWTDSLKLRVSAWGPYQIDPVMYQRALAQIAFLESGAVRYKAIDAGFAGVRVMDCIHAVSDLATGTPAVRLGTPGWGHMASAAVARDLRPWVVAPAQTHDWVALRLGIDLSRMGRYSLD